MQRFDSIEEKIEFIAFRFIKRPKINVQCFVFTVHSSIERLNKIFRRFVSFLTILFSGCFSSDDTHFHARSSCLLSHGYNLSVLIYVDNRFVCGFFFFSFYFQSCFFLHCLVLVQHLYFLFYYMCICRFRLVGVSCARFSEIVVVY